MDSIHGKTQLKRWLALSHVINMWTHFSTNRCLLCQFELWLSSALRALLRHNGSGIKGRALTRIVIFLFSLVELTLRRLLGNLEIMGCIFSRNEALSFRKKRKVSKVHINLNFSHDFVKKPGFSAAVLFKRFLF